jgi:cytochrome P450 family 26 subfamily A
MKTLTFNIISSLLFGLESGKQRDQFINPFQELMKGVVSVPINIPFTRYNRSLKASARIQNMLKEIVHQKTVEQEKSGVNPRQDLISCLLNMVEDDKQVLTEKEIIHNAMLVMVAGYDTSSVLITFIIRILANEPAICAAVLQGIHRLLSVCVSEKERLGGKRQTWILFCHVTSEGKMRVG